ncbi:28 kDa ribonucleoprotein, chloroplastic [Panicum miliaceum]|uniref:28 kDa ribonucleoprotein, chloroplastic n=1 Tax=Panicum miliaceum TaxID=4540 RepID=A0A3L6T981_PANMI|nr:28 kDa ribonucleoprotein, chloroplastic [Panicum miliaceum]
MANSCLSTAARAALRLPCPKFSADAAGTQLQLQLQVQYASVFPRPARAHPRLVADHVAAPAVVPVARRRGLAVTAMVSQEEAAATAVEEKEEEEVAEGQLLEHDEVAEQEQPEQEKDGAVEASSDDGGPSEAPITTATKLYFGNLPYNCDSAQLAGIMQEYATPEMVEVLYDRTTGRSRGFAFVTMTTVQDCELVIKNLDGTLYGGRTMKVNFADRPKPKLPLYPETEHKLFVGNLSWTVTSEMITEAFQRCGNVVGARVLYDGETGRSRGYGFVCYSTKEEMDEALSSLNGMEQPNRGTKRQLTRSCCSSTGALLNKRPIKERSHTLPQKRLHGERQDSKSDTEKHKRVALSRKRPGTSASPIGVTGSRSGGQWGRANNA